MTKDQYNIFRNRLDNSIRNITFYGMFLETKLKKIIPTDEDIDKMLEFFIEKEEYEFCEYLRKYKETKNNSLSNVAQ